MIESMANGQIKRIQKLMKQAKARKQEKTFVVEGWKMVKEALVRNLVLRLYVKQSEEKTYQQLLADEKEKWEKIPAEIVSDGVFRELSDTVTPQGILAMVKMPEYDKENICEGNAGGVYEEAKLLILEDIQDPGNMGTILRTAEGAGMSGVLLSKGCVDVFNTKVVRATMGALFRVPFYVCEELKDEVKHLQQKGFTFYAAHLQGKEDYTAESYQGKLGILIGNEANGLTEELADMAEKKVKIPMEGELESLNAAVSAALFAYEIHRRK